MVLPAGTSRSTALRKDELLVAMALHAVADHGELELANAVSLQPMHAPDALDRTDAQPAASAMAAPVQRVISPGSASIVSATTRTAIVGSSFGMREGRVLSQKAFEALNREAPLPAPNASLGPPVSRMIAIVPAPSAVNSKTRYARARRALRRVAVFHQSLKPIHVGRND